MSAERKDLSYYRWGKNYDELKEPKKLVWNVFYEDWNAREIVVFNIFEHYSFFNDLIGIKKEMKKRFSKENEEIEGSKEAFRFFEEKVSHSISYYYGSKSEWEIILTSWPPYVESEEIDRLVKEREERIAKWGNFNRTDVRLSLATKVDVYGQVKINWVNFMDYLWNNLDLIPNKKKKI